MFDSVGILILVGLSLWFGFLTWRAWRIRLRLLRWAGLISAGLLTLIPVALLGLALRGFYWLNERHTNPVTSLRVAGTPAQIARGEQLAHACVSCHAPGDQLPLSGVNFAAKFDLPPLGTLYAPNLTPGGDIDNWTDSELIRAIREGIHKNGRSLLVMPAANYRHLSDEDAQALVAYLRSQPATGGPTPANQLNLLGALFLNLAEYLSAQPPVGSVPGPRPGSLEEGQYMVRILNCHECHGDRLQGKVDDGLPGPTPGPNLTQIVPQWTEEQFLHFFNTGELPGGGRVPILTLPSGFSQPRMPWPSVRAATTDDELKAIYAYLISLPFVEGPAR
ncbi:MAG: c-type cytochrome [Anaerolineales bacterium]|nr:c-type cytochrome [Anaerolineales bacterium]